MIADRPFRSLSTGEQLLTLLSGLKGLIPFTIAAFGFLLTTIPFWPPMPVMPNVGLALVYLFALYRPNQLAIWAAMPLGIIADILLSMPVGANTLALPLFMLCIELVDSHMSRVHWLADWLLALPFILGYQLLLWMLCIFVGPYAPLAPFMTQGLATIAAFPLIAFLFVSVQRRFVDRLTR